MPEIINLKEEKVYFGSQFQRFQSMVAWLYCFGPMTAVHHGESSWWGGLHLVVAEKRREEQEVDWGLNMPTKDMPP
jgi:hypothetical protein